MLASSLSRVSKLITSLFTATLVHKHNTGRHISPIDREPKEFSGPCRQDAAKVPVGLRLFSELVRPKSTGLLEFG